MAYQTNPGRAVEESYGNDNDSSAISGRLLPDSGINVNVGASNSAAGEGTTTAELVAKLRFLNCAACLFIILFHSLPILLNPIRLTLLLSSPMRLILEAIVGILALFLFLVEARIPILGEKVLILMRGLAVGTSQCIDLDVARGRVLALVIMGGSLGLINYLSHDGISSSKSDAGPNSDEASIPSANVTDSGNGDMGAYSENVSASIFFTIIQCTLFSPTTLIAFSLAAYTLHVMHTFPEYGQTREYSIQDGLDTTAASAASAGPSWVSNVGGFARGNGYQNVGV
ncbi:hypothetical protein ACHAXR_006649 [Thalassiosira sp. AJA248-18]